MTDKAKLTELAKALGDEYTESRSTLTVLRWHHRFKFNDAGEIIRVQRRYRNKSTPGGFVWKEIGRSE